MAAKVTVKPVVIKGKGASTLAFGESKKAADLFRVAPAGKPLKYVSSDENVVSVTTDGAIKAVGMGTAKITASSKYAAKSASVEVSVLGEEGITAVMTNSIREDYKNTVLVNKPAIIKVQVVKNGKAYANEVVSFEITGGKGAVSHYGVNNGIAGSLVSTTNAQGVATFVIQNANSLVQSDDTDEVASVNYTVTAGTSGDKLETSQQVDFAAVSISKLENINGDDKYKDKYPKLEPATNDKGDGQTMTSTASTYTRDGHTLKSGTKVDYVDSQQTSSKGTDQHKVGFIGGTPQITFPDNAEDLSKAERFTDTDVAYTSNPYHTYTEEYHLFETKKATPEELTHALLNFSSIQLSAYTKLEIESYSNEQDAKDRKHPIAGSEKTFVGETDEKNFSYQLPLSDQYKHVIVRVTLSSAGQVNLGKNAGYSVESISGVYKTRKTEKGKTLPLDGATMEWKSVDRNLSQPETLFTKTNTAVSYGKLIGTRYLVKDFLDDVADFSGVDLRADKDIAKVTYQVPVFPSTGVAVFTCYDANNNIIARYAYPTVNSADVWTFDRPVLGTDGKVTYTTNVKYAELTNNRNTNVLDPRMDAIKSFYKITNAEADANANATVTYDGEILTINSDKTGYTSVMGELNYNGKYMNIDATNDRIYTSVQWSPLPKDNIENKGFLALIGQEINVYAQLVDRNGDAVSEKGVPITFSADKFAINQADAKINNNAVAQNTDNTTANDATVSIVSVDGTTDANGRAKLTLKSSDIATALNISAKTNSRYDVVLAFGKTNAALSEAKNQAAIADLYWVDADLAFKSDVNGKDDDKTINIRTTIAAPITTSGSIKIEPKVGTNWEYGVKTVASTRKNDAANTKLFGGVLDGKPVQAIQGLEAIMSKGSDSVGTVTKLADSINRVTATSTKAGAMNVISALNASSVAESVVFKVDGKDMDGVGSKSTSLSKKLTLVAKWMTEGMNASIFTINGNYAAINNTGVTANVTTAAGITTIYVQVTDAYGNVVPNKKVTISTEGAAVTTSAAIGFSSTVTDANGLVAVNVAYAGTTAANTTVSAKVDTITTETYSTTIHWVVGEKFELDKAASVADGSVYKSRIDANGNIILTFTDAIESKAYAQQFKVTITDNGNGNGTYDVAIVSQDEKTITLKLVNGPTTFQTAAKFTVAYNSATVNGFVQSLTSEHGVTMLDNVKFVITNSAAPGNAYAAPAMIDALGNAL